VTFIEFEVQKVEYNDKISHAGKPVEAKFTLGQRSTFLPHFHQNNDCQQNEKNGVARAEHNIGIHVRIRKALCFVLWKYVA